MIILPLETEGHRHDVLIVILGPDNLARMKEGDPAELQLKQVLLSGIKLVDPTILLCYEEPSRQLNALLQSSDVKGLIEHLQRGWKFRPEQGDHDRGPEKIKDHNAEE